MGDTMSQAWINAAVDRVKALVASSGCSGVEAFSKLANELAADLVFTHPKNALAIWKKFEDTLGVKEVEIPAPTPECYIANPSPLISSRRLRYPIMHKWFLVSVLACSCAAPSGPSEFHTGATPQIAPPRPNTTYTPAGAGMRDPGAPGGMSLPRSPYGRVLPEDEHTRREPGLWAADEPLPDTEAALKPLPPLVVVLGTQLELGEGWTMADVEIAKMCARSMDKIAQSLLTPAAIAALPYPSHQRACAGAHLFLACVNRLAPGIPTYEKLLARIKDEAAFVRMRQGAAKRYRDVCTGVQMPPDANKFIFEVEFEWMARERNR